MVLMTSGSSFNEEPHQSDIFSTKKCHSSIVALVAGVFPMI